MPVLSSSLMASIVLKVVPIKSSLQIQGRIGVAGRGKLAESSDDRPAHGPRALAHQ